MLLPTYQITDNIIFNAEIEFEHAGTGFDGDDKLHGTAEIEQVWVDFKIIDQFNWRAPGIDLIPIGYINEHHEPTQFYSVMRPELYNGLIPSTWKAPATSIYGTIADGLTYTIQASTSLEDFGDDFATRTDANTVPPFPTGYAAGHRRRHARSASRCRCAATSGSSATTSRSPRSSTIRRRTLPGFAGSTSAYYTPNTTPRGAYADTGMPLGRSSLTMFDTEFRYRIAEHRVGGARRIRLRHVRQSGQPARQQRQRSDQQCRQVACTATRASSPIICRSATSSTATGRLVPFYRYTFQNLQTGRIRRHRPQRADRRRADAFHNAGVAVFPSPSSC